MKRDPIDCTAILAWGSLIGELNEKFDKHREQQWQHDGPVLPIEFSRISSSREGALTLVIDPDNGALTKTWYAISKRLDPQDAACDLITREGTVIRNIGLYDTRTDTSRSRWCFVTDKVRSWLEAKNFRAVVWTDLPSNYTDKTSKLFSPSDAVIYVAGISEAGKAAARHYLATVPEEVETPFRAAAKEASWFTAVSNCGQNRQSPRT